MQSLTGFSMPRLRLRLLRMQLKFLRLRITAFLLLNLRRLLTTCATREAR